MAYVLALRKGKSRRTKKKILLKNEGGLLEGSTVATQWPTLPCLPFTRVLKTDSSKSTASQSTSGLQTWLDSFPGKVKQSEKIIFKKIDQAWQRKDIDEMFQLIKVRHLFLCSLKFSSVRKWTSLLSTRLNDFMLFYNFYVGKRIQWWNSEESSALLGPGTLLPGGWKAKQSAHPVSSFQNPREVS